MLAEFDQMMRAICETAAEGVRHYMESSRELADLCMPEYFVSSYVVAKLGSKDVCFTLETNVALLKAWSDQMYERAQMDRPPSLSFSAEQLNKLGNRVDLVWYPRNLTPPPSEAIWPIEFKRHNFSHMDRDKLRAIFPLIDRALGGAVFSIVNSGIDAGWVVEEREAAKAAGDSWYEFNVGSVQGVTEGKQFAVCGRVFSNPAATSLQEYCRTTS